MNRTIRSGLTVALLLFWHFIALQPAAASVIVGGWDLARGGVESMRDAPEFAAARAGIQLNSPGAIFTATNELTDAYLSTINVLVIGAQNSNSTVTTPLSASEQAALFNFVVAGGNVGIITEREPQGGPSGDATRESMIDPFGMDTEGDSHFAAPQHSSTPYTRPRTDRSERSRNSVSMRPVGIATSVRMPSRWPRMTSSASRSWPRSSATRSRPEAGVYCLSPMPTRKVTPRSISRYLTATIWRI